MTVSTPARPPTPTVAECCGERLGLRFEVVSVLSSGANRKVNSDARLSDVAHGVFAVCDGVSTLADSARTANRVVALLSAAVQAQPARDANSLSAVLTAINGRVFAEGLAARASPGACTLVAVAFDADKIVFAHVGDGAAWAANDGAMRQITTPQRVFQPSTRDPTRMAPRLAAAIGAKPTLKPWVLDAPLERQGAALLATDGLEKAARLAGDPWFRHATESADLARKLETLAATDHADDLTAVAVRWHPA